MKIHSLLGYGRRVFCPVLLGCALISTHNAIAHSPVGSISSYLIIQQQVSGTVTDISGPLAGVTVSVKGKPVTAVTDSEGKFSIEASPNDVLAFSYVGYLTMELSIEGKFVLDVRLKEDVSTLQEVTINAGYYSVTDRERTGSIAKVKKDDIELQPVTNPLGALQGRMSGVQITQAAGTPGSGFSIQIRGTGSLRSEGNDPLYVVNGVPYASQPMGSNAVSGSGFGGLSSPLSNINPADIESIEVLKDADATAIYGSRGANGVVLITTKKGKSGKTSFELQAYTSLGKITRKLDVLGTEDYLALRREAFANDGITEYPANAYDVNGTWDPSRSTDWQQELIGGTAEIRQVQLSASGGSAQTQFLISGTMRRETTVFPGDANFSRASAMASLNHRSIDEKFSLDFSSSYTADRNTLPGIDLTRQAYTLAPNAPALYLPDGGLNWQDGTFENPLGYLNSTYENTSNALLANLSLGMVLPYGFTLKASAGYSDTGLGESRTLPATIYNPAYNPVSTYSELLLNDGSRRSWIAEPQLHWQWESEHLKISALAGATFQSQTQEKRSVSGFGFSSDALIGSLAAANSVRVLEDQTADYRYGALFGRVNLTAHGKYILNLTGRRDGSSRFGPGNRFANFGALGGAWLFSRETFMEATQNILSHGKLRASYGTAGSDQIGDYQYLDTYQVSQNLYGGITGIAPSRLLNPDFGWETNRKLEAALELGFLQDRIALTLAAYRNRSSSQLVGIPLPGTTGFATIQANLGATVENAGIEIEWKSENFRTENFSWSTTLNITKPKNRLLAFPGLEASTYRNSFVIGQPLGITKLYRYEGVDPETGIYTFQDADGDGQITSSGDRTAVFDPTPQYFGGLGNQLSYRNWTLDFLLQFVKQEALRPISAFPLTGTLSNQPSEAMSRWPDSSGPQALQRPTTGANFGAFLAFYNYTLSDAMVTDASFVRLKNISIAYTLKPEQKRAYTAKFYLQGQNLLTFTSFSGADPETRSLVYLPPLRQFTFGVQLSF